MPLRRQIDLDKTEGTVQLVDVRHNHQAHREGTDVNLVPVPSDDPNDPLRFPIWKKNLIFGLVATYVFVSTFSINGLGPAFPQLAHDFDLTAAQATYLLSYTALNVGLANFLWIPIAAYFGKRPVFVLCTVALFASTIWAGAAQSYGSLLGARVLIGIASGPSEALSASVVNDLFFLHERGQKMGIYMVALTFSSALGPMICGFAVTGISWRWYCWICTILNGITMVMFVFFVPETRFERSSAAINALARDDSNIESSGTQDLDIESADKGGAVIEQVDKFHALAATASTTQYKKKTYVQSLSLWSGRAKNADLLTLFIRPFPLIFYPTIL